MTLTRVPGTAVVLLAAVASVTSGASAQAPTVAPALQQLAGHDTTVAVWFFGRDSHTLASIEGAVRSVGARVRRTSRWLHAVSADLPAQSIALAQRRTEFRHLQPVARFRGVPEQPSRTLVPIAAPGMGVDSAAYGGGAMPMRRLGLFPLVDHGVRGAGVTIALLDTGFETELPAFDSVRARIIAQYDFVSNDPIVRNEAGDPSIQSRHGTAVWSTLAANVPGTLIGVAPDAMFLLAKTEYVPTETRAEEDNFVAALEWADSLGANVISSSLGYLNFTDDGFSYQASQLNGDVAVTTIAADMAAQRGIVVVTSAGNCGQGGPFCITSGFRSLMTPADGDSVIAVGSEDSTGVLANSSSRGPTADRRLKPDLTAPGVSVFVVDPLSMTGYGRMSGTSFSAPLVAGVAALVRQVHPALDVIAVREALKRTGTNRIQPDSSRGWGRPNGGAAVVFPSGIAIVSPGDTSLGSATPEFQWTVPNLPAFVGPVAYRVRLARDSSMTALVLDTLLADTAVRLLVPQLPTERLFIEVTATTSDSIAFTLPPVGPFTAPPWSTLSVLNDAAGTAVRTVRPQFSWISPPVASPPGPFTYDVRVIRADDHGLEIEAKGVTTTTFTPAEDLETNTPYRWEVTARLGTDSATTASLGTFLILDDSAPVTTLLFQNFPNPFPSQVTRTATTCIWFDLATPGQVTLDILDVRGHVVAILIPPTQLQPARYGRPEAGTSGRCDAQTQWDGTARDGSAAPRGIYLARLATPDGTFLKRVVFLGAER